MIGKKSNKELKKKKAYAVAGILAIFFLTIGYALKLFSEAQENFIHRKQFLELSSHISNEVGVALLIAIVLALTIEKLTFAEFGDLLNKQTKAIKENVFNYIMEHSVPREITREIESQILKAFFVRRGLTINYTIEPVGEEPGYEDYVKVGLKLTYTIENLTSKDQLFEIKHTVEQSPEPLLKRHVKFTCLEVEGCAKPLSKDEKKLASIQKDDGPDLVLRIPGIRVYPGENKMTTVTVESQTIKHLKRGADYHIFRHHSCDIELIVHLHNLDLEVNAGTVSHNSMEEGEETNVAKGLYHWKSKLPLLAGQNIYVTWVPKTAPEVKHLKPAPQLESVPVERSGVGAAPDKK